MQLTNTVLITRKNFCDIRYVEYYPRKHLERLTGLFLGVECFYFSLILLILSHTL